MRTISILATLCGLSFGLSSWAGKKTTYDGDYIISRVDAKTLHFLGQGLQDEETQSWIKLACVGKKTDETTDLPNCDLIRAVFFRANSDEAFFFGKTLVIADCTDCVPSTDGSYEAEIKKQVKDMYYEFALYRRKMKRRENKDKPFNRLTRKVSAALHTQGVALGLMLSPMVFPPLAYVSEAYYVYLLLDSFAPDPKIGTKMNKFTSLTVNSETTENFAIPHKMFQSYLGYQRAEILQ